MTKTIFSRWVLLISMSVGLLLLALLLTAQDNPAEAAPAANTYAVTWYTADNGGGISSGGSYEVAGTIGQMDAASTPGNPDYGLDSGFWAAFIDLLYEVFLPVVIK
jgi:hypothetical protein